MRKPKLLFKVNRQNMGKVYVCGKWQKDVTMVDIHGEPWEYTVEIERYTRKNRKLVVKDGEIETERKVYRLCRR